MTSSFFLEHFGVDLCALKFRPKAILGTQRSFGGSVVGPLARLHFRIVVFLEAEGDFIVFSVVQSCSVFFVVQAVSVFSGFHFSVFSVFTFFQGSGFPKHGN